MKRLEHAIRKMVPAVFLALGGSPTFADAPAAPVNEAAYRKHLARLASDEFGGRKPGTEDERRTLDYLEAQARALGLEPANDGSFRQPVPVVEITAARDAALSFETAGISTPLAYGDDMVIWSKRVRDSESLAASPMVFVGHGVIAPEFGWNDYAGVDMRGKTAVILINDPGFSTHDPTLFRGQAMTYYGRWTYKFEEAARQGASGALIVHETVPASYGWQTVVNSWTGPQLDRATNDDNAGRVAIEGWITQGAAERLFAANGLSFADAKQRANSRGFRPEALSSRAAAQVRNGIRRTQSHNFAARLRGSKRPDECVVYLAHWDHLGRLLGRSGDAVFNGAVDNATGTAGLLAIAESFVSAKRKPERSILFLAVTLEESGLLGSAYYADHPLCAHAKTAAAINMDAIHFGGPRRDVIVVGHGASELEEYLAREARARNMRVVPEHNPERGSFFRSDHFNFAREGVPALYIKLGIDDRAQGQEWGLKQLDEYNTARYHQVADEYTVNADVRGAVEALGLLYGVGARLSRERSFPNWYRDSEFRAARDRSRAQAAPIR
jgi:Zn-dependent M28 family amino/carboxypeptidase